MDEAQVKALIAAALGEFETKVTGVIDQKNSGLAANITREIKKLIPEKPADPTPADPAPQPKEGEGEGKLTMKALQQQLEALKKERDDERTAASNARRATALTTAIAKARTLNQGALQKLLNLEYGDSLKEENGNWLIAKGEEVKSLDDAIATYLATDEGKAFLPPSGTAGAGSNESRSTTTTTAATGTTAGAALMEAF